jgi:hypothetical protein
MKSSVTKSCLDLLTNHLTSAGMSRCSDHDQDIPNIFAVVMKSSEKQGLPTQNTLITLFDSFEKKIHNF